MFLLVQNGSSVLLRAPKKNRKITQIVVFYQYVVFEQLVK